VANPDPDGEQPTISRRTILLGSGFAVANLVLVGALLEDRSTKSSTTSATGARPQVKVVSEPHTTHPPAVEGAAPAPPEGHVFDRVIAGGRVIDPETGYDQVADVGIDGGRITKISTDPLHGKTTIDAANLVVAPGFIDLLSYEPNDFGTWYKIGDGVTTNLGMHGLNSTPESFFSIYGDPSIRPPVHYGGAFDDPWMRTNDGIGTHAAYTSEIAQLSQQVEDGFAAGWLGVDFEPEYTPWVTDDEIIAMSKVAAEHQMPVFFHARYSSPTDPGKNNATALAEILQVAETTGASVHVDHITSTGGTHTMHQSIETLEKARSRGIDVTACMYPYNFWATYAASSRFNYGWQQRYEIGYGDLQIPGTDQRLDEATFAEAQANDTLVAAYAIPDADVVTGLQTPWTMIGSDCILDPPVAGRPPDNHPRGAGCFTRVLGHYVREQKVLTLTAALSKMTIQPAKRLERRVPALRKKGRLQRGADADITVFDPKTVGDRSTIDNPAQMAAGVDYVLVMGQVVKDQAGVHHDVRPGLPIKSELV
jgi:N-acyl-D-aspartate/D-glutamate deacylase